MHHDAREKELEDEDVHRDRKEREEKELSHAPDGMSRGLLGERCFERLAKTIELELSDDFLNITHDGSPPSRKGSGTAFPEKTPGGTRTVKDSEDPHGVRAA